MTTPSPIATRDREEQAAVLDFLLDEPAQLTIAELQLAFGASGSFSERDAVEQAVGELVRAGLVRRQLESVAPTRAAIRFRELASYWP